MTMTTYGKSVVTRLRVRETMAERWRRTRPADFASADEMMELVLRVDPEAKVRATDLGAVIVFSDGSQHRMGAK